MEVPTDPRAHDQTNQHTRHFSRIHTSAAFTDVVIPVRRHAAIPGRQILVHRVPRRRLDHVGVAARHRNRREQGEEAQHVLRGRDSALGVSGGWGSEHACGVTLPAPFLAHASNDRPVAALIFRL